MKYFNFHVVRLDQLNVTVNAHVQRGYAIDRMFWRGATNVSLLFVQDLPDDQWQAKFERAAAQARASQAAREERLAEAARLRAAKELRRAQAKAEDVRKAAGTDGPTTDAARPKRLPPLPSPSPTPRKA